MKNLFEYINPKESKVVIPKYNLKTVPIKSDIYNIVFDFLNNDTKEYLLKKVEEWYEDNKRRKTATAYVTCQAIFYANDSKNKLLMEVINEIESIGVSDISGEFNLPTKWVDGGANCGVMKSVLSSPSYTSFKSDEYNYRVTGSLKSIHFDKSIHANGNNGLSADDMNIIRQKLYDCMIDTTCEIVEKPSYSPSYSKNDLSINYVAYFTAQYDNRKLKKLLDELKNDRRLQNFAKIANDMRKGIDDYYASKKPGDYVGD